MTERKLSTLLGILIVILGIVSLDISGSMQAQDITPPLFPTRAVGSGEGYEGLPQWDGDIPINRQDPGSPEVLKKIRALTLEMASKADEGISSGGETTLGSTLRIAGKDVKLPDDVYVANFIAAIACIVGTNCPEAPVYHLKQKGTAYEISVSVRSGIIVDTTADIETNTINRQAFQWLVNELAK